MRIASTIFGLMVVLGLGGCPSPAVSPGDSGVNEPSDLSHGPDLATVCGTCAAPTPVCDVATRKCVACAVDNDCPAAELCKAKKCVAGCTAMRSECGDAGACDLDAGVCHGCRSDKECGLMAPVCDLLTGKCGACTPAKDNCPDGQYCGPTGNTFACAAGCKADAECRGQLGATGACCQHVCVDTSTATDNCGVCGTSCGNGTCCTGKCANTQSDVANCGGCAKACPSQNNQPTCVAGVCGSGACSMGFADCDNNAGNGCEVSTGGDTKNCGGCGMACNIANANPLCFNGACVIGNCHNGFRDCNGMANDGCEVNLQSDPANCGACGQNCAKAQHAVAGCMAGMCVIGQCDQGFADCNAMANDGCESQLASDPLNCNGCGMVCPGPANVQTTCTNGACGVTNVCVFGFKDCDANPNNGCEINLQKDASNCGSCGNSCGGGANGVAACAGGVCTLSCNKGFGNCNNNLGDGCESNTATDKNNCGQCGNACPQNQPFCMNGICTNIVKSCKEIIDGGLSHGDGLYMIDPDGQGGNAPFQIYCEMTSDGGGWEVMAYIRNNGEWDWALFTDQGVVGDVANGFASGATLRIANDVFTEKIIIYKNLIENGQSLGQQFMIDRRADNQPITFSTIDQANGWGFRDSFGKTDASSGSACSHGCGTYRTYGMFHDSTGISYHGTQGGNYGCRDGNNICWMTRGLGCNVGGGRCAYLTGNGEGVIYAVRNK